MSAIEHNKWLVRRLVEIVNRRDLGALEEVASGQMARRASLWIGPFAQAFPDFRMEVAGVIAEAEQVVGHFKCSGTHEGDWQGLAPTGRRFHDVDEVYIFGVRDGRLDSVSAAVEDNLTRMRQLGLSA